MKISVDDDIFFILTAGIRFILLHNCVSIALINAGIFFGVI